MEIYNLIKSKRTTLGLTQDDVAIKLNVTRQAVQNWENNKRAIPNNLIAKYFKILDFNAAEILSLFG
jgi:transcriptional regulator with XRE-family HTH domain